MKCEAGHQGQSTNLYGYRFLSNKAKCLFNLVPHLLSKEIERPFWHRLGRLQVHVLNNCSPPNAPRSITRHWKNKAGKSFLLKDVLDPTLTLEKRAKTLSWLRADETNSRRKKKYTQLLKRGILYFHKYWNCKTGVYLKLIHTLN